MQKCDICGNQYDKCFSVTLSGKNYIFDCFECAIHKLAPQCIHCGCKIIGHGVESNQKIYCCVHCAKNEDESGLKDRN